MICLDFQAISEDYANNTSPKYIQNHKSKKTMMLLFLFPCSEIEKKKKKRYDT